MSRALAALGAGLICAFCMEALAGWVLDGRRAEGDGETVVVAGTNVAVRAAEVNGTSLVYVVISGGHTNVVGRFRSE